MLGEKNLWLCGSIPLGARSTNVTKIGILVKCFSNI